MRLHGGEGQQSSRGWLEGYVQLLRSWRVETCSKTNRRAAANLEDNWNVPDGVNRRCNIFLQDGLSIVLVSLVLSDGSRALIFWHSRWIPANFWKLYQLIIGTRSQVLHLKGCTRAEANWTMNRPLASLALHILLYFILIICNCWGELILHSNLHKVCCFPPECGSVTELVAIADLKKLTSCFLNGCHSKA